MSTSRQQPVQPSSSASRSAGSSPAPKKKRLTDGRSGQGWSHHVGVIGSGNLARAIVEGALSSGVITPSSVTASATSEYSENYVKMKAFGVNMTTSNHDIVRNADIIVIAVKPHQVPGIMSEIQAAYSEMQASGASIPVQGPAAPMPKNLRPLLVSAAAAVTLSDIEQKTEISWNIGGSPVVGHLPVVRCLPNIACSVRAGLTAYCRGKFCNETDAAPFVSLFSLVGYCEEAAEKYLDAFAAFGSAVAFMGMALESMADGGVLVGLPRPVAQKFSAYTMLSAAKIVLEGKQHPAELKDAVSSPGGTTIHGIQSLERAGFRSALIDAIKSAADRAQELRPKP